MIGLTGGYCAGKSEVARILNELGWTRIDVDSLGHRALELSLPEVVRLLGPQARGSDGLPDRRAIGHQVFADRSLLRQFEALVHPAMFALTDQAIEDAGGERDGRICLDAAILYRLPQAARCHRILEVRAPLLARIRRGMIRDGHKPLRIIQRILSQQNLRRLASPFSDKIVTVRNNGDREHLAGIIKSLMASLAQQTF